MIDKIKQNFFHYILPIKGFTNPLTIVKHYNTDFAFIKLDPEWVQKIEFREDYVTEEVGNSMCFSFPPDPALYLEINILLDNWDILTDRNPASENLLIRLLSFYRFRDGVELPSALTRRSTIDGAYYIGSPI